MKRFLAFWDTEGGMGYAELKEEEVSSMARWDNYTKAEAAQKSLSDWAAKAEPGDEYSEWDSRAIIIRVKDTVPPPVQPLISPEEAAKRLRQSRKDKRRNLIKQMNEPV